MRLLDDKDLLYYYQNYYPESYNRDFFKLQALESPRDVLSFKISYDPMIENRYYEYGCVNIETTGRYEYGESHGVQVDKYIYGILFDELMYFELCGYHFTSEEVEDIKGVFRQCGDSLFFCNLVDDYFEEKEEKPIKRNTDKKTYIIKNKRNGLYKIGVSKNPYKRERTLQSEEPEVEIVKVFDYNIEKTLHKVYRDFRVRGEWFNLNKIQLKYICTKYD